LKSSEIFGNGLIMPSPDVLEPPSGLSFGDLLDWHLRRGTRPPGSDKQGEPWKKTAFAGDVGVSDKKVRNWIADKSLPTDIITIERVLFGRNQEQCTAWRMELREALGCTRTGSAGKNWTRRGVLTGGATTLITGPAIGSQVEVPAANIPIRVPKHFLGRDDALEAIERALARDERRVAITALHGLRGVGKTTLAAAFVDRHRGDYRATWWIRAQTETTMRNDLIALAVRLGWVAADEKEGPAVATVMERLRHEGEGILLIYDNAIDADALKPHLPRGGAAKVLVTSNAYAWRGVAAPVEIRLWPKEIGADYLTVRTGRDAERMAAETLSEALGGLPLAHEQAAAYCERLDISLAEYFRRFTATPTRLLDDARHAPAEYHDGLTVAKTFTLAIEEAAKLHHAAEPLIVHAALLAPEPIPLFLFAEAREKFGEPLATALAGDGLDEAVAALRIFGLIDRESIADERNPTITTETIHLHRLVREVAAARHEGNAREGLVGVLIEAVTAVHPQGLSNNPKPWPRARRLDALAIALVDGNIPLPEGTEGPATELLHKLASFRLHALAAYAEARLLCERALAIRKKVLGPEHPHVAGSLNALGFAIEREGHFVAARPFYERALAINEKVLGPEHPLTAMNIHNLARLLSQQGDFAKARLLQERAVGLAEKVWGPEHPYTITSLINLAHLLLSQGDLAGGRLLHERMLAISENVLGPEHPSVALVLYRLAGCVHGQGNLVVARSLHERALGIRERVLGPDHPDTAASLSSLARLLQMQSDFAGARALGERALAIREKALGPDHPETAISLDALGFVIEQQGGLDEARPLYERALAIRERVYGPEHPDTARSLNSLAACVQAQGDLPAARSLYERALTILEKVHGHEHLVTNRVRRNFATLLLAVGDAPGALALGEAALAAHQKALGPAHHFTKDSARVTADALAALNCATEATALRERFGFVAQ
jgi:tetratricopeptide (TPR) repeat protein